MHSYSHWLKTLMWTNGPWKYSSEVGFPHSSNRARLSFPMMILAPASLVCCFPSFTRQLPAATSNMYFPGTSTKKKTHYSSQYLTKVPSFVRLDHHDWDHRELVAMMGKCGYWLVHNPARAYPWIWDGIIPSQTSKLLQNRGN